MDTIVTWMYCSPKDENILHLQMGDDSGTQEYQDFYWRCVFLLFESSARLNPGARHLLFVNKNPPRAIDGVDIDALTRQYNVEVIKLQNITKSPPDYYHAWNIQFIMLDVLDQLKGLVQESDNVFIFDNDIIFHKPLSDKLRAELKEHRALLYTIDYDINHKINGLTRLELLDISKEMNSSLTVDEFVFSGSEMICCLGAEIPKIAEEGRRAYMTSLVRYERGEAKFNEDGHLFSYVYHVLGYKNGTANAYIKRIWTDRSVHSNIDGSEDGLTMWHLPGEKKNGFRKVFASFREIDSIWQLTTSDFARSYRLEEPISAKILRYLRTGARAVYRLLLKRDKSSA